MAIAGKVGAVCVSDVNTAPVSFSDEPCTGDLQRKRYQIDDVALRYWDPNTPIIVEVDAVPVASGFALELAGGYIAFEDALLVENVVTVSGKALTLIQAGGFFNWNVDGDADNADATTFKSEGWKEFVRTLKDWSGSAGAYWGDTQFYDSLGQLVVVKLYINSGPSQDCLEGFALINGDGIEAPVDGLIEESIDFTGTGPLYVRM